MDIKFNILSATAELFMRYGIRSVTMDTIAKELAMSKKTIYQYFKDKNEIVEQVTILHLENEKKMFEDVKTSSKNSIEELIKVSKCLGNSLATINPSLLYDLQKFHPKAWQKYLEYKEKVFRSGILHSLRKGMEEGFYRPEINPEIIATIRLEQVQIAFDQRIFPVAKFDFKEIQMEIFTHFVYGIVTEKGRELYISYLGNLNSSSEYQEINS
jgi:TetR/AcrR family transcriptional regulator, cholesterol catabolism regulator